MKIFQSANIDVGELLFCMVIEIPVECSKPNDYITWSMDVAWHQVKLALHYGSFVVTREKWANKFNGINKCIGSCTTSASKFIEEFNFGKKCGETYSGD